MDFLAGLNPQQAEAVRHIDGPLLILAGAGSGKTRVITHRIAHMICDRGVKPWSVLAVTFTNKASQEMRDRVKNLLGAREAKELPTVSTFHSFCVRLLRRHGEKLGDLRPGFTNRFTIYDADDQLSVIKSLFKQFGLDDKQLAPRTVISMISNAKSDKTSPDEMATSARDPISMKVATLYEKYEARLREANALDFDDLLLESVRLMEHDDATRLRWNDHLHYLMIDEYQDTNRSQYELMRLLAGARRNVCVVGDEDQSIYSWRGADIKNILDFEVDFPNAKVVRLEQNYRSTKHILEASGAVVANNIERKGKTLWSAGEKGELITVYEALDSDQEALYIADTIQKKLSENPRERVAVLYRTNFQSRPIEEALRRYGRSYVVVGGISFYQRAEVKDMLAYLRVLITPTDNVSLLRVINTPARGLGKATTDLLEQHAYSNSISVWEAIERLLNTDELGSRAHSALRAFHELMLDLRNISDKPVSEVLEAIIEKTGYAKMLEQSRGEEAESKLANVNELVNAAADASERGESVADFLDHAALVSDADSMDEKAQVSLLTIHNAKGLEFPIVFLAGMEEGLFPHSRSLNSEGMLEEERRLCYVGMTRAERLLYLSWARVRRRYGGSPPEPSIASRFLREIPTPLVRKAGAGASSPSYRREVDLHGEQWEVRNSVRKNLYTGKTYNSVENISQFFKERGDAASIPRTAAEAARKAASAPAARPPVTPPVVAKPAAPPMGAKPLTPPVAAKPVFGKPAVKKSRMSAGATIQHPTLGRGTIVRIEGDGPDAKVTVSFPGHGLKKLIAKYAGLTDE